MWAQNFIERLLSEGKHTFLLKDVKKQYPEKSVQAIGLALARLVKRKKAISVKRGFYVIVSPLYAGGAPPPFLFIDDMMKAFGKPYYLGLLSAAALHGAGHQQPQSAFVVTNYPSVRAVRKKAINIRFFSLADFPFSLIEKRKTETGYVFVSCPALTACDLLRFERRLGGLSRVSETIDELCESINPDDFSKELLAYTPVSVLRRLGYILESVLLNDRLSTALWDKLNNMENYKRYVPLKPAAPLSEEQKSKKWGLYINENIKVE